MSGAPRPSPAWARELSSIFRLYATVCPWKRSDYDGGSKKFCIVSIGSGSACRQSRLHAKRIDCARRSRNLRGRKTTRFTTKTEVTAEKWFERMDRNDRQKSVDMYAETYMRFSIFSFKYRNIPQPSRSFPGLADGSMV